ncbi:hypothetical protein EUGRSUZ_G00724 [Eucalyptus grandis]|uniref:Uncharacterized protein n=2 Tax=Eucalyptus grandis TaxID=71139 RepID=A0ACC3K1Y5_EUCGR|nr:hypothetical protein EUGRSUZ_G00724 [Eucalyptus grandis]
MEMEFVQVCKVHGGSYAYSSVEFGEGQKFELLITRFSSSSQFPCTFVTRKFGEGQKFKLLIMRFSGCESEYISKFCPRCVVLVFDSNSIRNSPHC